MRKPWVVTTVTLVLLGIGIAGNIEQVTSKLSPQYRDYASTVAYGALVLSFVYLLYQVQQLRPSGEPRRLEKSARRLIARELGKNQIPIEQRIASVIAVTGVRDSYEFASDISDALTEGGVKTALYPSEYHGQFADGVWLSVPWSGHPAAEPIEAALKAAEIPVRLSRQAPPPTETMPWDQHRYTELKLIVGREA